MDAHGGGANLEAGEEIPEVVGHVVAGRGRARGEMMRVYGSKSLPEE